MQKHLDASDFQAVTLWMPGLFSSILILVLLTGCGQYSTILAVEAEHACDESRYIRLTNRRTTDISLQDWMVTYDSTTYVFPDIVLAPGESIYVWSGAGIDDAHNIYINRPSATWDLAQESLQVERPPSLFGDREIHFLRCQVDITPP